MTSLDRRIPNRFPNLEDSYTRGTSYFERHYGDELRAAIDRLYDAFKGATLSIPLNACCHCFTDADVSYVATTHPRLFTHGDLHLIATKLVTTLGDPCDVAYFVPRLIEAIAEGACIEPDAIIERIRKIPVVQWTNARRKALSECLELLFASTDGIEDDFGVDHAWRKLRDALPIVFDSESERR